MTDLIQTLIENNGPVDDDHTEEAYCQFKAVMYEIYGWQKKEDYDEAIKAYCDRWKL